MMMTMMIMMMMMMMPLQTNGKRTDDGEDDADDDDDDTDGRDDDDDDDTFANHGGHAGSEAPLLFVAYAELTPIRRLSPIEDAPGPSACAAADVLHDFFCIRKMPRGESGTRCAASSPKASGTRCAAS